MLWKLFTLAFYELFRASKLLSNLSWSDFTLSLNHMSITLRQSKTDPFRHGQTIHIFATGSTCPIRAITIYCNFISNKDYIDPVFHARRFQPLTQKKLNEILHCLLQQGGINQADYASHSFRIGAATTSAAAGIPAWLIKTLGRWSSNAYMNYIRYPRTAPPFLQFYAYYLMRMLLINHHGILTHPNSY